MNSLQYRVNDGRHKQLWAAAGLFSIIIAWPLAIGVGTVTVDVYLFAMPIFLVMTGFRGRDILNVVVLSACGYCYLIIQLSTGVTLDSPVRSLVAIPAFGVALIFSAYWLRIIRSGGTRSAASFFAVGRAALFIELAVQIAQLIGWAAGVIHPNYHYYFGGLPRVSGIFSEPSHVAIGLAPFVYMIICHPESSRRFLGRGAVLLVCLIGLISPSATLIAVVALASLLRLVPQKVSLRSLVKAITFAVIATPALWYLITDVPVIKDRIIDVFLLVSSANPGDASANLSSLLFIKGLQMAEAALRHFPAGVGMLNMSVLNSYSSISDLSYFLQHQNASDGTSLLFKLVGEFGYAGALIAAFACVFLIRRPRQMDINVQIDRMMVFGLVATFIRGTSYFDGVPLLGLAVIYSKWVMPFLFRALRGARRKDRGMTRLALNKSRAFTGSNAPN